MYKIVAVIDNRTNSIEAAMDSMRYDDAEEAYTALSHLTALVSLTFGEECRAYVTKQ